MSRSSFRRICATALLLLVAACASRSPAPVTERPPPGAPRPQATVPAPVPPPRAGERPEFYTVKPGDTIYSIAITQGVDYRDIATLNGLGESNRIQVGQVLRLRPVQSIAAPGVTPPASTDGVQVNPITGAAPIEAKPIESRPLDAPKPAAPSASPPSAVAPGVRTEPRAYKLPYTDENLAMISRDGRPEARIEPKVEPRVEPPKPEVKPPAVEAKIEPRPEPSKPPAAGDDRDRVDWQWPATGRVIANFDGASKGVDISGKPGEPVLAAAAGRVVYSGSGLRGYGQLVIVKHNDTYLSAYAHNSRLLVKEGQTVTKGQKIAELGQTDSDRPKLHFEIRRNGKPVDPLGHLPGRP